MLKLDGVQDLIKFVRYLRDISEAPWFRLSNPSYDAVMVTIDMPGIRLEVEFFEDHVEYSMFEGDESVHDDQTRLFAMLEDDRD